MDQFKIPKVKVAKSKLKGDNCATSARRGNHNGKNVIRYG